jgi:hypothetical protein
MKTVFLILIFQSFLSAQEKNDPLFISPVIFKIITIDCEGEIYRLVVTREGVDHLYNRLLFQQVFYTEEGWDNSSLTEIKLRAEEEELEINILSAECINQSLQIDFTTLDFWEEIGLKKYFLVIKGKDYTLELK